MLSTESSLKRFFKRLFKVVLSGVLLLFAWIIIALVNVFVEQLQK